MAETIAKKRQRNYLIDVWKLIFCYFVLIAHFACFFGGWVDPETGLGNAIVAQFNDGLLGYGTMLYQFPKEDPYIFKMFYTLGFFTFMSGYWLMDAFKRNQRAGILGRGRDMRILWNDWSKRYAGYLPYLLVPGLIALVFILVEWSVPIQDWFQHFVNSIPELTGINAFGFADVYDIPPANAYVTDQSWIPSVGQVMQVISQGWYMQVLIAFGTLFTFLLMWNERAVIFGIMPALLAMFVHTSYSMTSALAVNQSSFDFIRIWGPAAIGMWAWYLIDYLKKHPLSESGKKKMTVAHGILLVVFWVLVFTWERAGLLQMDALACLLCIFALAEQDYITQGINALLNKAKGFAKQLNSLSLGVFLMHYIVDTFFVHELWHKAAWFDAMSLNQKLGLNLLVSTVVAIIFLPIDKFICQKITKGLIKVFHSTDPIVIDETAPAKQ